MNFYRLTPVENPRGVLVEDIVIGSGHQVSEPVKSVEQTPIDTPRNMPWLNHILKLKAQTQKAKSLVEAIEKAGFPFDEEGNFVSDKGYFFSIPHIVHAITGKKKPRKSWKAFLHFIAGLAFDYKLLSPEIRGAVKRIQNEKRKKAIRSVRR